MNHTRQIVETINSQPTMEGAGVHLRRGFGFHNPERFDPFLLFDDFRSDTPEEYLKGFPWHPHRGIETITYVLKGDVEHGDSLGNKGIISSGDVQWMTAGSGIVHQEMPKGDSGGSMHGFQLWLNLAADEKMCAPRYRDVLSSSIPQIDRADGVTIKVICGKVDGTEGPVSGISTNPQYLDIDLPPDSSFTFPTETDHTVIAYVIDGEARFTENSQELLPNRTVILFGEGDHVVVQSEKNGVRFLLFSGKPLQEPIAWQGPIVMNSQEELDLAFKEYREGTFLKHK